MRHEDRSEAMGGAAGPRDQQRVRVGESGRRAFGGPVLAAVLAFFPLLPLTTGTASSRFKTRDSRVVALAGKASYKHRRIILCRDGRVMRVIS